MSHLKNLSYQTNPTVLPTLGDYPRKRTVTLSVVIDGEPDDVVTKIDFLGRLAWLKRGSVWLPAPSSCTANEQPLWHVELDDSGVALRYAGEERRISLGHLLRRLHEEPRVVGVNLGRRALEHVLYERMNKYWGEPGWDVNLDSV